MSGRGRFADSTRTSPEVREGPILFSNISVPLAAAKKIPTPHRNDLIDIALGESQIHPRAVCALQITCRKMQSVFEAIISPEHFISNYKGW